MNPASNAALPPLNEIIKRYQLTARKSLGQHFLLDANLTARIARAAGDLADVETIEIGPGPGGLTRALLLAGAKHVTAIERDERAIAALGELSAIFPGKLTIVAGDALKIDPAEITSAPRKIVANLPYNIGTPLLINWLAKIEDYRSLTVMLQKEVALRLVAKPNTKDYGRLSIMTQWRTQPRLLFDISPQAFVPPPKVTSTLIEIIPLAQPQAPCRREDLERVVAAGFGQRRKMLRASLKSLGLNAEALLNASDIPPTARAEDLTVEEFCRLARNFASASGRPAAD